VIRVDPELVPIPEWARKRAVRELSKGEDYVWLRPGDARALAELDRDSGGKPDLVEFEFRLCKNCGRPLIGDEARIRRMGEQAGRTSYMLPCGDDCYEAQRDGRWRKLD
jgi:hypothetical protein